MSPNLSASVGRWERRARNRPADVEVVQRLLETAAHVLQVPQLDPKGVDGKIAHPPATSNTVAAIEAFQGRYTSSVDGLIKPDSQTWHALLDAIDQTPEVHEPPSRPEVSDNAGECFFPFPSLPVSDWTHSPRAFGSNRNNGRRAHAGCDLYFEKGTWIYAIADGTVTRGPYPFYCETFALEVDHGEFLARYGEIQKTTTVKEGDRIHAGEQIGKGRTLDWHSSPERYVAPGVVRQDCIGTVNDHRCRQIKEKIGWDPVYASDGSGRSYFPIESVAGLLPESLAVRH
jgi:murein DD-endopeptidase MepM/ murein hydrolase activator NlpD